MPYPALVFGAAAAGVAAVDVRTGRLPRHLTGPLTLLALLATLFLPGDPAGLITQGLLGGGLASGLLLTAWFAYPKGLGFGDVLYVFPVGFMVGTVRHPDWTVPVGVNDVVWMLLYAFTAAVLAAVVFRQRRIKFGPCLFTGWVLVTMAGPGVEL